MPRLFLLPTLVKSWRTICRQPPWWAALHTVLPVHNSSHGPKDGHGPISFWLKLIPCQFISLISDLWEKCSRCCSLFVCADGRFVLRPRWEWDGCCLLLRVGTPGEKSVPTFITLTTLNKLVCHVQLFWPKQVVIYYQNQLKQVKPLTVSSYSWRKMNSMTWKHKETNGLLCKRLYYFYRLQEVTGRW